MLADPDAVLAQASARFLDLVIAPEHLPGVVANLLLLQTHAARIAAVPLPREIEPAPVFSAVFGAVFSVDGAA